MTTSPTVAQWQLATDLRKLREDRKLGEVAKAIKVNISTVSRWETPGVEGVIPGPGSLERLLEFYGLSPEAIERFLHVRKEARSSGWWQSSGIAEDYGTYIGLESAARRIRTFEPVLIPGLMQTEGYVRALFKGTMPSATTDVVDAAVEVRMNRQSVWQSSSAHMWAIVSEAAIRTTVGGPKLMAEQLRHLVQTAEQPNVTFQVLPFEAGAHAALEIGAFTLLTLDALEVLMTITDNTSLFWDDQTVLNRHTEVFERLLADAWRPAQTIEFLSRTSETLEKE
ncbi:helix-turn-helix transcriptional regulator [Nocardiopsis sp. CNT312]|uniref:helix-turn-helix domain-containing protein n=1 Tax=Nocardiopsis sp. CNT312 TaxID=1137268 RepID=UPI00048C19AC|nr:helix-turn-helix transcriptional regulator [Nocardiopsis sp. CNT312]